MSTENHPAVDRTHWPPGPWNDEPDKLNWRTASGLPGMIVRNNLGGLCGYVAVAEGHPCFQRSETSEYETGADGEPDYSQRKPNPYDDLSVHGGVTFTNKCGGKICHVPEPGEPDDVWWVGFDCVHSGDWHPPSYKRTGTYDRELPSYGEAYRDIEYVKRQVESLAEQLATQHKSAENKEKT